MTSIRIPALLALLLSPAPTFADSGPVATLPEALRAILKAEHDAGRFDGVALVARGETLLCEAAFGQANRAFGAAHRVDEPFPVASVTKQFVAVMVLQLVERGKLAPDDTLASRLPGLEATWAKQVTLRHLLTHTSGLPQPDEVIPGFYSSPDLAKDAVALARLLSARGPKGPPGGGFSYNNTDYVYLAAVIETALGMPLADALRDLIASPSGMGRTGMIVGREIIPGLPEDYDLDAGPAKVAPHYELANFSGAGAAYSTARDLWAFDRALMGRKLLRPETTALMLESSPRSGYAALGCWAYPLAIPGGGTLRVVERHGSIGGYNVVNLYVPETGVCIVLASNVSSFVDPQTWNRQGLAYLLLKQVTAP